MATVSNSGHEFRIYDDALDFIAGPINARLAWRSSL